MLGSLRARMIVGAFAVLTFFLTAAGIGQERAFRAAALSAEQDKLRGLVYALLGVTEATPSGGLIIADFDLPDPRLTQPDSGLAAWLLRPEGELVWRSPSALHAPPQSGKPNVGDFRFATDANADFVLSYGLRWVGSDAEARTFHLVIEASRAPFRQQLRAYRQQLLGWLLAAAGGLIVSLSAVLAWLLAPVRRMERQLQAVERGEQSEIGGRYPDELQPLVGALNAMVQSERNQQTRYRNALGDLAHSLKTPLTVLDGMLREGAREPERMREQVDRMRRITEHQLSRAAHAGRRTLAEAVPVAPLAAKIAGSLGKVYHQKTPDIVVDCDAALRLRADEGDLYELLGNLMDNACKWCRTRVRVHIAAESDTARIIVDDDGPGFPEDAEGLLARGRRADEQVPGQGLGLASVHDLVTLYEGAITLDQSPFGGARVTVTLRA